MKTVLGFVLALSAIMAPAAAAQTLTLTAAGSITGPIDRIRAQGSFVYIAHAKTLAIFDVSDPAAPKRVGTHTFEEQIWGFRLASNRVYVANGHSGLAILDISKPSAPVLLSLTKLPGQAKNVSVAGNRALLANHMSGLDVVDISNEAKPAVVGSAYLDGYARDVATTGSLAVAVDNPTGVYVFDMNSKDPLEPVIALQSATAPQQVEVTEVAGSAGRTRIAVLAGSEPYDPLRAVKLQAGAPPRGGSIQLYDVSNPTAPVFVAAYPAASGQRRLAVKGSLVYVADGADGVQVLDVSTPSKATVVGRFKTTKPARDVAVGDSVIAVALGTVGSGSQSQVEGEVLLLRQAP